MLMFVVFFILFSFCTLLLYGCFRFFHSCFWHFYVHKSLISVLVNPTSHCLVVYTFFTCAVYHCHCGTIADIKPLRFQAKVFHHWKQREKTFRKQSRTNNGDFSFQEKIMGTFYCLEVHIKIMTIDDQKRVPTHIKPAQQVKPIIFFPRKGLMRKTQFLAFFKWNLKHFPTLGTIKFVVNLDCLEVHIHNIITKTAPRHSLNQPNDSNLPFFSK